MESDRISSTVRDDHPESPGIDRHLIEEAKQARQELESLGIWIDKGSQVRSPFTPVPDSRTQTGIKEGRGLQGF